MKEIRQNERNKERKRKKERREKEVSHVSQSLKLRILEEEIEQILSYKLLPVRC